ncbi:MAG: OmpA family protein [Saprospiraceae bacterium]
MNTKVVLLSLFTVCYFVGTQWWYSNKIAGACCNSEQMEDVAKDMDEAVIAAVAPNLPMAFKWANAEPVLNTDFNTYKKNTILKGLKEDNILQITGNYYEGEVAPEGFDNMGLARAAVIREMLKEDIPIDRVDISSRLLSNRESMENSSFDGASFSWKEALKKEETTIVEVENESTIYFPFNSSVKDQNPQVDAYLSKLAERLKQTDEKISIVGHTDNVGEEAANVILGMNRAASIRNILEGKGIPKDRISIDSKGESQPATSNDNEDGRYRNRRTVLRIVD